MPKGISHSYQLDQSISVLRVFGWYLNFKANSGDPYQTPRLIWVCTVCLCPTKRKLGLYGLNVLLLLFGCLYSGSLSHGAFVL